MKAYQPRLLRLADNTDPILHKPTKKLTFPLSIEDQQIIQDMLYSIQAEQLKTVKAPWDSAAGMAANQWGISKSIFLFCPHGEKEIEVIINPSYEAIPTILNATKEDFAWEACFSVPRAAGLVKRYTKIKATYQNITGEWTTRDLSGWEARVFQHEADHLNGYLYDDPALKKCTDKKIVER